MDQDNHIYHKQDIQLSELKDLLPCMMGDLLEYFEERARVLDSMAPTIQTSAAMCNPNFISCITFNGIPILPPVLTARRREEMQEYKRQAMRRNYQRKTRQREQMNARLNSLVKDVEKSYSLKSRVSLPRTVGLSKLLEKNSSRWTDVKQSEEQEVPTRDVTPKTHQGKTVSSNSTEDSKVAKAKVERSSRPSEVKSKIPSQPRRRHRSGSQGSDDDVKSEMTVLKKQPRQRKRTSSEGEKEDPKSEPIKAKQKLRIPVPEKSRKNNSASPKNKPAPRGGNSIETLRRSSSLSSLPNLAKIQGVNALAIPRPPSSQMTEQQQARQLSLRHYSNSQPDLRTLSAENINFSPPTRRSHSKDDISDLSIMSVSREHSMSNPDLPHSSSSSDTHKVTVGLQEKRPGKDSTQISGNIQDDKKDTKKTVDSKKLSVSAKSKVNSESEQKKQVTGATKKHVEQPQNSSQMSSKNIRASEQSETSKSETASSDFPSLEGCNSLPHEIDGLRFTSVRQQHIGHTLDKLSKVLNMEETLSTLNSTSSNEIQENISRLRQSAQSSNAGCSTQSSIQTQQSFEHAGGRRSNISPQTNVRKPTDTPSPKTSDSTAPGSTPSSAEQSFGSNTSGSSNTSHSRVSASIRSSASSVAGSQTGGVPNRRMSPKGLKNAVHFAPLVTEISTSASQSLEDKISVRKLDVTPTNSMQFDSGVQGGGVSQTRQVGNDSTRNRSSDSGSLPPSVHVTIPSSESMLSKVALSPETDSPQTPNDCVINNMPFETYGQNVEGEMNTSDKENELRTQPHGRSQISSRHVDSGLRGGPGRNMDLLVVKSQNSDDGSQTSTLKGSQDLLGERSSVRQEMDPHGSTESQVVDMVRNANNRSQGQQIRTTNVNPRIAAQSQPVVAKSLHDTLISTQESSRPAIRGNVPVNISGKTSHVSQQIYDLQQKNKKDVGHPGLHQQAPPILTHPVAHTHSGTFSQLPNTKTADRTGSRGVQRKLDMDAGINVNNVPPKNASGDSDGEREAKAEHIQKYLSHVQRHSLEADVDPAEDSKHSNVKKTSPNLQEPFDLRSTIQSFTSSLQSLNQADEEELLRIQAEHFDKLRRHLIEQQKQQLEELFVHQRREQLVLQTDIEKYQSQLMEQEAFLSKNSTSSSYNNLSGNQQVPAVYSQSSQDLTHQPPSNVPSQFQSQHSLQSHYHIQSNSHSNSQMNSQTHSQSNSYSHPYSNSHSFSQSDSYSHPQSNSQSYSQTNIQPDRLSHHHPQLNPQHQQPNPQQPNISLQSNIAQQQQPGQANQSYQQNYPCLEQYVQRTNPHTGYPQQQSYDTAYTADRGSYPHGPSHVAAKVSHPAQVHGQSHYVSQSNYHQPVDIQDPNYFRQPSTQHPAPDPLRHNQPPPPKYSQHDPRKPHSNPYESQHSGRDPRYMSSHPHGHNDHEESPPRDDANTSHQYSYVPSPSLYYNPRDNGSDISTFSKATPKQSLTFNNHSTPTPKIHKPVLRSPIKQPSLALSDQHVIVPEMAYNAKQKRCFDRVSACVKGYLTRRLLRTEKVQEILKTIKDTKEFAYQFQAETPIKRGDFSSSDRYLLDRIIAQLQAALLDIHEIFFEIPVWERMSLIAQSRQAQEERRLRESAGTRSSVSSSQPRISSATLKAMERKRKQEEEVAVSTDSRPRSAPPPVGSTVVPPTYGNTSSQITTQARINSQNNVRPNSQAHTTNMDQRALRPLPGQGQSSQTQGQTRITTRPKERPKTAPNQTTVAPHPYLIAKSKKSNIPSVKDKQSNKTTSSAKSSGTASSTASATTAAKNKPVGSKVKPKVSDKSSKAWRG